MSVTVKEIYSNDGVINELLKLDKLEVVVGVSGKPRKQGENDKKAPKINMAELAAIHEFGSQSNNIPARSFLLSTLNENSEKYAGEFNSIINAIESGKSANAGLSNLGNMARRDILDKFKNNDWQPIKPETKARRRKVKNPTNKKLSGIHKPLIDTGELRKSIMFQVRNKA